jgi:serine/threonine protein kinase
MELVDGETLADRLALFVAQRRTLPVAETLAIARQVADALDSAHEKGIIHRDLKPANIALTRDGVVKVLDFGLAKAARSVESDPRDVTAAPTATIDGTSDGLIIGTVPYMSPEQARGQAVDKRTDIWALGCVLYEMLAGRPAFAGGTVSDTLAAVLERDPDFSALPSAARPHIAALVRRCLEKNPKLKSGSKISTAGWSGTSPRTPAVLAARSRRVPVSVRADDRSGARHGGRGRFRRSPFPRSTTSMGVDADGQRDHQPRVHLRPGRDLEQPLAPGPRCRIVGFSAVVCEGTPTLLYEAAAIGGCGGGTAAATARRPRGNSIPSVLIL